MLVVLSREAELKKQHHGDMAARVQAMPLFQHIQERESFGRKTVMRVWLCVSLCAKH
jgi:hypothetical protein